MRGRAYDPHKNQAAVILEHPGILLSLSFTEATSSPKPQMDQGWPPRSRTTPMRGTSRREPSSGFHVAHVSVCFVIETRTFKRGHILGSNTGLQGAAHRHPWLKCRVRGAVTLTPLERPSRVVKKLREGAPLFIMTVSST